MTCDVPRCFVTYHPAVVLYPGGQGYRQYILDDLKRLRGGTLAKPLDEVPEPRGVLAIDTEYLGEELLTVGISDGRRAKAWEKPFPPVVRRLLASAERLVVHSAPDDVYRLVAAGLLPPREAFLSGVGLVDSLLLARLADENQPSYQLEDLLASLAPAHVEIWKAPTQAKDPSQWTASERLERCRLDAWAAWMVAKLVAEKVDRSLYEFTARTAAVLHRMHLAGAVVDLGRFRTVAERVAAATCQLEDRLRKIAISCGMTEFSPTNDHRVRELLYDRLGLPVTRRTPKTAEPAVTRRALEDMSEQLGGGASLAALAVDLLIEHSIIDKFRSTYAAGLEALIRPCGRLPDGTEVGYLAFNFNPLGARTGRRSSSNPNSQNWPKAARRIVRSRWVGGKILSADFSRLEPCVIAWLAGDEELLGLFLDSNGYVRIAEELWGQRVEEGTPVYRAAKSIILGVHYDMQTDLMAEELWASGLRFSSRWTEHWAETDRVRRAYLARFPKLGRYMEQQREARRTTGQVVLPSGRVRHLPGEGKHLDNQAINFPVQGTASDISAAALLDVEKAILREYKVDLASWVSMLLEQRKIFLTQEEPYGIIQVDWSVPVLFNEVHDELVVDVPPGHEKRAEELVTEAMTRVPTFRKLVPEFDIPLRVDLKLRARWHGND